MSDVFSIMEFISGNTIITLGLINLGLQWFLWIFSAAFKTEKFFDLAGSSTFLLLTYLSYLWSETWYTRQKIQCGMIMVWALRLGLFLFIRVLKSGGDRRFHAARDKPALLFLYWTLQAVWVFVTLLPTLLLNSKQHDSPLKVQDFLGWSLWTIGIFFEVVADYQKSVFRCDPANKDKFICSGLWKISRHPNYFGEIILWFGLYLSASSVFHRYNFITVLCPIFNMVLLTRISGIPVLEDYGMRKWGRNPSYRQYVQETSVLVPFTCRKHHS